MSVRIACPGCGRSAFVEELSLGQRGRCKQCGHVFALVGPGGESGSGSSQPSPASAWKGEATPGPASASDLPEQFGRYRIMRRLGMGGMGAVYLAQDVRLGRSVALKVPFFHPMEGAPAIARFEREARAAATLDHPNLCPVYDVGEIDGIHYLTMPFLDGKPLSEAMPRGRVIPEAQAASVARKLALALAEAHAQGVIHRDLKPGNIMVSRRRELVIMDFGLARVAGSDAPLTVSGHVLGTALYMAPEQAAGHVEATGPPCDVYSLGVILYELLTGVRPFEGPWSLVIGLKSVQDPEPPSVHRPGLDPRLDQVCRKAIARVPADRYQTMAKFAAALEPIVARAPASIAPPPTDSDLEHEKEPSGSLDVQLFAGLVSGTEISSLRGAKRPAVRPTPVDADQPPTRSVPTGVAAAGGFAAVLLLGIIITIATDRWRTEIKLDGRDVRVDVQRKDDRAVRPDPVAPAAGRDVRVEVQRKDDRAARPDLARLAVSPGLAEVVEGEAGRWRVEGKELLLEGGPGESWLLFGDPNWTDYNFQFTATHEQEASGLRALFRSPDPSRIQLFNYGWSNSDTALIQYNEGDQKFRDIMQGGQPLRRKEDSLLRSKQPYTLKVIVRGRSAQAYCDHRLIFEAQENRFDRGRIGFGTRYGGSGLLRIKDISVKSPDGTILWEGPPRLAGWKPQPSLIQGDWKLEGAELIQTSLANLTTGPKFAPTLVFGDEWWSNYDLSVEVKKLAGADGPLLSYHWQGGRDFHTFCIGNGGNRYAELTATYRGDWEGARKPRRANTVEIGRWYTMTIQVRGASAKCFVDGELWFDDTDPRLTYGRVALRTNSTSVAYRNLRVTTPGGVSLWQGFPELSPPR